MSWKSWDENRTTPGQPLCLRLPDPASCLPQPSLGMSLNMWWKEGKNQSHIWAVQPGRTILTLLFFAVGTWEDGWYLGTGPECEEEDEALWHLPLSSLPPLPLSCPQPSYLFAAITVCSACCVGSSGSRNYRSSGVFASSQYPSPGCRVLMFLALPWLWPDHLSAQGKAVGIPAQEMNAQKGSGPGCKKHVGFPLLAGAM